MKRLRLQATRRLAREGNESLTFWHLLTIV